MVAMMAFERLVISVCIVTVVPIEKLASPQEMGLFQKRVLRGMNIRVEAYQSTETRKDCTPSRPKQPVTESTTMR